MIQTILQKVLDNLNLEKPDLSYIKGMVEVLLAMNENKTPPPPIVSVKIPASRGATPVAVGEAPIDEGAMLDSMAAAQINNVKKIVDISSG